MGLYCWGLDASLDTHISIRYTCHMSYVIADIWHNRPFMSYVSDDIWHMTFITYANMGVQRSVKTSAIQPPALKYFSCQKKGNNKIQNIFCKFQAHFWVSQKHKIIFYILCYLVLHAKMYHKNNVKQFLSNFCLLWLGLMIMP